MGNQNSSHPFWALVLAIYFALGCLFTNSSPIIRVLFCPSSSISILYCSFFIKSLLILFFMNTCLLAQFVSNSLTSRCFPIFSSDNLLLCHCNLSSTSNYSLITAVLVLICSSFQVCVVIKPLVLFSLLLFLLNAKSG